MYGFCPLASGSKGNAIYFGSRHTKILIDAGISGRATEQKLALLGVALQDIEAIIISHDHVDHIQGLKSLALKHNIPVLANAETAKSIYHILKECPRFKIFETGEPFTFKDLSIFPFSIQHDTVDPVAFTIKVDAIKVGICTDLGFPTTLVRNHLRHCDYLYLEANHEPAMVHACSRPMLYKERVLSRSGHLSNEACADVLQDVLHPGLKHVYLAHLSQECNLPARALERVRDRVGAALSISIALQEDISQAIYFT